MGGILSSLSTSYSGLQAHQVMVDVTGNNISNASDEFYSRQKVVVRPEKPIYFQDYNLGRGVSIETIARAHDEFVFSRYRRANEESQFMTRISHTCVRRVHFSPKSMVWGSITI